LEELVELLRDEEVAVRSAAFEVRRKEKKK
jgi:hypothetical protein